MKRTLSEIPREKWTVQYPDVPVTVQPRYRGQHLLHVDENGKEKCVACYLCAAACPSDCIYIEAETDPRPYADRIGRDERYARVYNIDYGRCIFCGNCVEYCPTNCLSMTEEYELATFDRHELNYDNVALGRLPYSVVHSDPMVTPLRELGYLPKGVIDPHGLPAGTRRAGKLPEELLEGLTAEKSAKEADKDTTKESAEAK